VVILSGTVEEWRTILEVQGKHPVISVFFKAGVLVEFRSADHRLRKVLKNK
jgi:hypothetical protein